MLKSLLDRLGAKILIAMASALTVTSFLFLGLIVPRFYNDLLNERMAGAARLGNLMEISLKHAMLTRDIAGLRSILSDLGKEPDIEKVVILDNKGEVRFSSNIFLLGTKLTESTASCPDCVDTSLLNNGGSQTFTNAQGNRILRTVNVIANQEECTRCHRPVTEQPINGFLTIDLSTTQLEQRAMWGAIFLAIAGFIALLLALGVTWLALRKLVLKPVRLLTQASKTLAAGDLTARTGLTDDKSQDEIHILGSSFDRMAERLDTTVSSLREQKAFQQALIDAIPDGIRVLNEEFSVVLTNREFCRQVGMSHDEIMRKPCYVSSHNRKERCVPTMTMCPLSPWHAQDSANGFMKYMHIHANHCDNTSFPVEVVASRFEMSFAGQPQHYIVEAVRDVSKQVEISQEQRLSEIGHLATGVAHEIRNPLASISLGIKSIKTSLGSGDVSEIRDYMKAVEDNIEECIVVTERLLHLSRLPTEKGELLDIRNIINDTVGILRYEADICKVETVVSIPENLRIIGCDGSIRMVAFNIIQNAFHAMPNGGRLVVTARERYADKHIEINIADSGIGISPDHLPMIFYPFWSWRADESRGSGLGLAICKSTVERWFGEISVSSRQGVGTTFTLTFPPADEVIERI